MSPREIILCQNENLQLFEDLYSDTSSIYRTETYQRNFNSYIENSDKELWGIKENGLLLGALAIYKWKGLPYFTIYDLALKQIQSRNLYIESLNEFLIHILDMQNNKGYFTFFTANQFRPSRKKQLDNFGYAPLMLSVFDKYDAYLEEIVPENSRSKNQRFDELLGSKTHPFEMWIRRYSLKMQYRKI